MKPDVTQNAKSKATGNSLQPRLLILTCLTLCLLMIGLTASPLTRTQLAASRSSAQPRPTPPNDPLDEAGLAALKAKLMDALKEVIEDEGTQTSITEKWDARMESLVGKTARQVVDLFLADVKSVVEDDETVGKLKESFSAAASESNAATEPEPTTEPTPTPKPNIWIKFVQEGRYYAHFELTWDEPGKPNNSWKQYWKPKNWQETVTLSGEATNIRLIIQSVTGLASFPPREIFNRVLQPSDLNKCYRVTGTNLGGGYDNNCQ